jgi:gliding motility-associated-like protein
MHKVNWLTCFFLSAISLSGQNLIPNSGFEQCDRCNPSGFIELGIGYGANTPIDWNSATFGSPDIYSLSPRTGRRHGGFFVGFAKHEYLTNHFTECLKPGAKYEFSFWIRANTQNLNYIIDEIGIHIQKGPAAYQQSEPLRQINPVYKTPEGDFIYPSNYRQFQFEYLASGGEDHFIVGRFQALSAGDTLFVGSKRPSNPFNEAIYYFVDDFEMKQISPSPDLLPSEISLCPGETKTLTIPSPYDKADINWSTGEKSSSIQVPNQNQVFVEIKLNDNCNTILRDTTLIKFLQYDEVDITGEQSLCIGDTITLTASCNTCLNLKWSTNEIQQSIKVTKPGLYKVQIYSECGESMDSIEVKTSSVAIQKFIQFPNVIAPNGEELNRQFAAYIRETDRLKSLQLSVYNRWGKRIYNSKDLNAAWQPSSDAPMDTYMYICEVEYQDCDRIRKTSLKGSVTLVR